MKGTCDDLPLHISGACASYRTANKPYHAFFCFKRPHHTQTSGVQSWPSCRKCLRKG